ncbi:basement membrane-specific heparan sulfate proteoglycan core protein-like isoform X2 [Aricia agestis]|uniref:basement membrane-specific heparan sulfate proteoglycan core protein-like isoform X2 n=1 Tax=Aricia agestis TaxID=91739 RepID=UPI001C208A2D|nr:basement membrane-specific heparan sulfate proteoglycan core protein-like isoform X2 [Aricia agestis]
MRFPCLVLVALTLLAEVFPAEDIYWEGDDVSNEFLEVEPEDSGIRRHLNRFRRDIFDFWNPFGSSTTTTEAPPEDIRTNWGDSEGPDEDEGKEDGEYDLGSGSPDKEPEKEKTLHVTFVVVQPYQESYSNRDSPEFQNFSRSLAGAVDSVFEKLPGTHRASLVRIQSRTDDEFTCKVTLDIVTNGDTNQISEMLHNYIRQTRSLGGFVVNDEQFSSSISDPSAPLSSCSQYEIKCSDGRCLPASALCNGVNDCSDGGDETNCPFENEDGDDQNYNQSESEDYTTEVVPTSSTAAPATTQTPKSSETTTRSPSPETVECASDEMRCDEQRCLHTRFICNRERDCDDGTDEEGCNYEPEITPAPLLPEIPAETCGENDFRCDNNKCIESFRRCDRVVDCAHGEDEMDCECNADEFRCEDTGTCIEARKVCDKRNNCRDGSDERNCAEGYFKCRSGKLIPDYKKCNRRYDCDPGDYSDEQNCPCGEGDFKCDNGYCILPSKRCDRTHDCQDGSDERDCIYGTVCMAYQYKCSSGHCVQAESRCNGTVECVDHSDEKDCPCKRDEFKCRDGSCVNLAKRCDGQKDCLLGEDELNCAIDSCRADEFTCDPISTTRCGVRCNGYRECDDGEDERDCDSDCNVSCDGQCLDDSKICDGTNDCSDGSDEQDCSYCDGIHDFRCDDGECINANLVCNNLDDCRDGSDERDCGNTTTPSYGCNENQFQCASGACIDIQFHCDKHSDCVDNSDEDNCPCDPGDWQCTSGECIRENQYCDGKPDCRDYSDEIDCPFTTPPPYIPLYTPGPTTTRRQEVTVPPVFIPRPDIPLPEDRSLKLMTHPENQSMIYAVVGGDVEFSCRDTGNLRAPVRWVREDGRPLKPGSIDNRGRLEMFKVTTADSGVYICQATSYLGQPGSEVRATLIVESAPVTPHYPSCLSYQATCWNGQCISKTAVCDGRADCSDGSDEESCHSNGKCEPNQFKCNNGKCVVSTWVCDGDNDCEDNSDEANCLSSDPSQRCKITEFSCRSRDQCIPRSFHCDGQFDCIDRSDEVGCSPVVVIRPPSPSNVRLIPGDNLTLECEATGVPTPLISWRLNWGHVPPKCRSTSENGIGKLYCPNMQFEDSGAYSCEAINKKSTAFANPDSIVFVKPEERTCPSGYFNSEARSENECIRCFCFGKSTECRSADLYTYNMPTPLGEGGTRLLGVSKTYQGDVEVDKNQQITEQFYYQPLRNGATVTKLALTGWSNIDRVSVHPYLTLPETYNGNQLKSYGGHIKYRLTPHSPQPSYGSNDGLPDIIIVGKYQSLSFVNRARDRSRDIAVEARLTVGNWQKPSPRGTVPASREDIMMALDDIKMILLRADMNNGGVNITDFTMESGQYLNAGLGAASLVEECTCPEGYEGLSCQKCASGYERVMSGPWLGTCVARRECPPGTYGDPNSGGACKPCPCPLTNRENQFARTCALGSNGRVICDCMPGYEGEDCSYCAPGYYGNPLFPGNSCKPKPSETCNPIGTVQVRPPDECVCKDNVQGRNCDQCKNGSYYLSNDFRHGCAQCFCAGVIEDCTTSNYRRVTTSVNFNVPQIVDQVKLFKTGLVGSSGTVRYNAPQETELQPMLYGGEIALSGIDRSQPAIYYWSLPASFSGNKVTSYGGFLNYQIKHIPSTGPGNKNNAADVQLISLNGLTFHYFGNFAPSSDGTLNATVQFLEKGWQRSDGKPVTREYFLLALADVKTILVKATYTSSPQVSSIVSASIDTATPNGNGPQALHVEQCMCPEGYIGTSCEDCAPGYTRTESGLYLKHCGRCECNGHSSMCHPDTGECYDCADNTAGPNCEECAEGYERDGYNNCVPGRDQPPQPTCNCDPRGESRPCEYGYCSCKQNVEGQYCDRCRNGTFGLQRSNPLGCTECYCSGATRNCHEASHYNRISIPAPMFEEDYGGYSLMDINADNVINNQFVPVPTQSELKYIFTFPPNQELYWSLPVFPGNRVLSYGGSLSLTQMFETNGDIEESRPDVDVVLVGDELSVYWSNPNPIRSGEAMSYQVPLREDGWYILNSAERASRFDFMAVLKDIKRVLVRATLSRNILSTSISDVSMDTAAESYDPNLPAATGVEICLCPEGYTGTSCESCSTGYYKDESSSCRQCPCNGHDCQLDSYNGVVCNCRPPYSGPDCSSSGNEVTTTYRPNPPRGTVVVKISSPTIKIQEIGSTVNFTCQARSRMTPRRLQVTWRKADGELPYDRTQFDDRTGAIIITNLQISDSGMYVCESNDGVSTEQATATLKVPGIEMTQPEVFVSPQIKDYYEGDRLELECSSRGNPAPTISWQRGPSQALSNRFEVNGNTLIIDNLLEEDTGDYSCIASNAAGSARAIAVVNVRPRPSQPPREKLTVSSTSPSVGEGEDIRLVCTASPNVAAGSIEWVRQDGTPFLSNMYSDNGVLYVVKADAQNQGVYMCRTPSYGVSPVLVVLTVIPLRTPSPVEAANITINKDSLEIPSGGSDTVECIPEGNPVPYVKWSRSDESNFGSGSSQRENTLIISNAQESDSGYYTCEAIIDGKPIVRKYIYVNILKRERPEVEIYPKGEISMQLGSQFELTCIVNAGIPPPAVTWDRSGGRPLSPHVQIQPNKLSFQNIEVNDEGDYTCTAANEAGTSSATATLKVRSDPEIIITPSNLMSVAVGDKVEVECRADGYPQPEVSITSRRDNRILVPSRPRIAKLSIPYVTDNDDDDYICTATSAGITIEEQFAIRVERGDGGSIDTDEGSGGDDPHYPDGDDQIIGPNANNPSNMIAQEGKDAVITCNASSEYRVRWDRADRRPLQDNARQINADLIIYSATKRDSGRYQCTLINQRTQEAQISAITSLIVLAAPRINLRPQTQTVRPGESTTVECVVEGDDIRSVFWTPIDSYPSRRVELRNSTLRFRQIEVEDAGQYKCTAISGVAEAYAIAEVIVSEDTDRETESHDNEQYAGLGAAVHLSCNVTQRGLTIHWKKDDYALPPSVIQRNDGSLYIRRAQKSDSGHYVCTLRDQYGRETNNYINLHIGDRVDSKLISIEKPERPFRVGDRVEVLCRAVSKNVKAQWERYGTRQYVDSRIYGDGALLIIPNVQESDAGVYRCNGEDVNIGRSYEDFNLEVIPGPNEPSYPPSSDEDKVHTARHGDNVELPCNHNLQGPITVEWKREYQPLPPNVRSNEEVIRLDGVTEADAGTYICKVSNSVARVTARATLRVIGVIPKFNGDGWISMRALKDAYTKFDIEVSFKPLDGNGIILYNSENDDEEGDYVVLQLVDGVPKLTLKLSRDYAEPVVTTGDRPLQLNTWHTIRLSRSEYRVTMDVDNTGPFVAESSQSLGILDLHAPLYIGNGPERSKRPYELQAAPGFIGCVSMLILGKEEKNILAESFEQISVSDCDSCSPNQCLNKGVCQEARNERGYMCLCAPGFAGLNCDRTGEACRPGLCGPGKCKDTVDGYKCSCPVTYTGKNCDNRQNINYPAFTGSAYLAIEAPKTSRSLRMSMKIKAKPPVTDGIIMYCAQSDRGYGGFTALTVHDGRLEFRYDLGDGNPPIVLVSNRTLTSEWTDVHIARVGQLVSLKIDMMQNYEAKLASPRDLHLGTPMFVGGVDGEIVLNNNTGVSGGFSGCIKDVSLHGGQLDLIGATIQSANIQECVNYDRGDIPEVESVCSQCRNNGYCTNPDASACICQPGFTGTYCESRLPLSNIMRPPRDPCNPSPCRNGGTCKMERGTRLNYTCDCPLGYSGANCQMPLELLQSVGFNGNGYLELPMRFLRYDMISEEPVLVAMAFHTTSDGVLLYQTEASGSDGADYLMLRIERGAVVMEWDMGSGANSLSLPERRVTDGERHQIIAKLYDDMRVELTVDGIPRTTINNGISNVLNADSNIYIGGIPEHMNVFNLPGLVGCIEQVEFNSDRSVNLGRHAIAGRNTQPCKDARLVG